MEGLSISLPRLWPSKIRYRLILGVALVNFLLTAVFVYDMARRQRQFLLDDTLNDTRSLAMILAVNSSSWVLANDVAGLREIIETVGQYTNVVYAMVISSDGRVLAHTDKTKEGLYLTDDVSRRLLKSLPDSRKGRRGMVQVLYKSRRLLDVAAPVMASNGRCIGWARVGMGQEEISRNLTIITRNGILYTLSAILAGSLFAFLMGNRLLAGLNRLLLASAQIRDGRRDVTLGIAGGGGAATGASDEIAVLGGVFDQMLDSIVRVEGELKARSEQLSKSSEQLSKSSEEIRDLYNNAPCGYHSLDKDGTFVRINDTELDWLGYTRGEVIGKMKFSDILTAAGLEEFRKSFPLFKERGWINDVEHEVTCKGGRLINVLLSATVVKDAGGEFLMSRGTMYDITKRKVAEELTRIILRTSIDGFTIVDLEGRFLDVNDAYCAMVGYSREELLGMRVSDMEASEEVEDTRRHMEHIVAYGTDSFETAHRCKDGKIVNIEISVNYFKDRGMFCSFLRDITARKKMENELNELNRHLWSRVKSEVEQNRWKDQVMLEQSRQSAIGDLLVNIAHQWRQPLGAVAVLVQDIRDAARFNELTPQYMDKSVKTIMDELRELSLTIDNFRKFYHEPGQLKRFGIAGAIRESLSLIGPNLQDNNIAVDVDISEDATIEGYPNEFSKVVMIILNNARDVFKERNIENCWIKIRLSRDAQSDKAILSISDNAGGVSDEVKEKMFDPYFTTKDKSRGAGLGLYMARAIITHNLNGTIKAHNAGGGMEFVIEV